HRVRLPDGILPEWLVYRLKYDALSPRLEAYFTGSTIKHLTGQSLKRYVFPLPPLAEQQRIVTQVEALLAEVSAARERLAGVPAILRRFRQSVLAAACSGQLTADWRDANSCEGCAASLLKSIRSARRSLYEQHNIGRY